MATADEIVKNASDGATRRLCALRVPLEARAGARTVRVMMTAAVAVAIVSAGGAVADAGQRDVSKVMTRTIDGTTIIGDSDTVLWKAVLDVLPTRPARIQVLDLGTLSEAVRTKLHGLDGFVLAGQTTIVVIRQGATLRQAAFGNDVDRLVLASLVWHEMAHANGSDECAAFAAEEILWRRFISTGRVQRQVGMAYIARLHETVADRTRLNQPRASARKPCSVSSARIAATPGDHSSCVRSRKPASGW